MAIEQDENYYAIIKYHIGDLRVASYVKKSNFPNASTEEIFEIIKDCVKYDIEDMKKRLPKDEIR